MSNQEIDKKVVKTLSDEARADLNADPITGEPGAHPVGTAAGGLAGAAAGATLGALAGPLGALIGGAIGAFAGGKAGSGVGELLDPTIEEAYWREHYVTVPYYKAGYEYERDYRPAFATGYANRYRYPAGTEFDTVETDLSRSWNEIRGDSRLTWEEARLAARDAWYHEQLKK
ncbi:hypothetical protein ACKLNO_09235 [Neisseriaceae bacterium B1]